MTPPAPSTFGGESVLSSPTGTITPGSSPQVAQYSGSGSTTVVGATVSGDGSLAAGGALTITSFNGGTAFGDLAGQSSSALNVSGVTLLTGLPNPVNPLDATTKAYVDAAGAGQLWHADVQAATSAVLPNSPTYNNGSGDCVTPGTLTAGSNGALTIVSYAVLLNDRVLVQNQAAPAQNGAYTETQLGDPSHPYILTRASDFCATGTGNIQTGANFAVINGTSNTGNALNQYSFNTLSPITV